MIDIRNIRYFVVLAEELHFGRAAEKLNISQPPLSFAIQQLEGDLGIKLFERTTRSVALTEGGTDFLVEARRLMIQFRRCESFSADYEEGIKARLQFGFTSSMLAFDLTQLLKSFEARHPQISIELIEMPVDPQLQEIYHHRLHAGFCPSLTSIDRLDSRLLYEQQYACCLPLDHVLAQRPEVDLGQLRDEDFIVFARDPLHQGTDQTMRLCAEAGFPPRVKYYVRSWLSAITLVSQGLGVCLVPRGLSRLNVRGIRLLNIESQASVKTFFVWSRQHVGPALKSFIDHLDSSLAGAEVRSHA